MSNKTKVPVTAAARLKNDYLRLKKEPIPLVYAEVRTFKNVEFRPNDHLWSLSQNSLFLARSGKSSMLALLHSWTERHAIRRGLLSWRIKISKRVPF